MPSAPGAHPPVVKAEEVDSLASLLEVHDPGLGVLELKTQLRQHRPQRRERRFGLRACSAQCQQVSRRRESHPPALAEPGVNLSAHRAPIVQPSGRTPKRQWANRPGWRRATSAINLRALPGRRRSRLYFFMAHRTRMSLRWRKTGYNMDL